VHPSMVDTLPVGVSIKRIDSVSLKMRDGTIKEIPVPNTDGKQKFPLIINLTDGGASLGTITVDNVPATDPAQSDRLTFTVDNGKETDNTSYTLNYTTQIKDKATYFTNDKQKTFTFDNTVKLEGYVGNVRIADSAKADAAHSVTNPIVSKGGTYNKEEGSISWTVIVNKAQIDMQGMKVIEDLGVLEDGVTNYYQELDPNSIEVYPCTYKTKLTIDKTKIKDETVKGWLGSDTTLRGFNLTIPKDTYNTKTLAIKFKTYLTDTATIQQINNKVTVKNGDHDEQTSNTSNGGYDGNYDVEDQVKASKRPMMQVIKYSSNSVDPKTAKELLLAYAKFEVKAYEEGKSSSGIYQYNPIYTKAVETKNTISSNGRATFTNLQPNYIYALEETQAPAGYTASTAVKYVMFVDDKTIESGKEVSKNIKESETDSEKTVQVIQITKNDGTTEKEFYKNNVFNFENTPLADGNIEFTKKNKATPVADSIKNVTFTFTKYNTKLDGTIKSKDDRVKVQTVISGNEGKVTSPALDPGTYIIEETKSVDPYALGGVVKAVLSYDETATKYTYTIAPLTLAEKEVIGDVANKGTLEIIGDNASGYTLTNDYQYSKLEFVKTSENNFATQKMKDVTFTLTGTAMNGESVQKSVTTDANGVATFDQLPLTPTDGYYTLTETAVSGYNFGAGKTYYVTVTSTVDAHNVKTAVTKVFTDTNLKTEVTTQLNGKLNITNIPIKGSISFVKKVDPNGAVLTTPNTLSGVTFKLYPTVDENRVKDAANKDIVYEVKSDIDGMVTFNDVDFGNYELVESTPKGYLTNQKIIITTTNLASAIDTNNQSFAYKVGEMNTETAGVVYNKVNIKKINFTKQNQDGSVIKEAMTFDLSRQGSGGTWDDTNQKIKELDITSNAGNYVPYGEKKPGNPYQGITEDSQTGVFSLANIPNGNYKIKESKGPSNIQTGAEITIELEITDEAVKWRSYKGTIASGEWTPLTKEGDAYKFTATNDVKYGYIQLSKYHAELDSNGNKVVSTNKDQKIPVSGVTFNIYNNDGSDPNAYDSTDTSLGSVTTNEEGALNLPPDGKYGDKHLIYGETYWVVEQTKDGYTANSTAYKIKFESANDHEQVAWLSEGKETPTYKEKNDKASADYTGILNVPVRQTVTLTKNEIARESLPGAEFVIYDKAVTSQVPVATLVYKDSSKKYELSYQLSEAVKTKLGITVLTEKNAQGIKYLDNAKTLTLLYGQYEIKEIIAPNGYKVSSTPIEIETKDFSETVIKNLTDNQT
ncbi:MAG: SpaA isopeptide-forming pilin-related protein, partial [Eubacterium sp.]